MFSHILCLRFVFWNQMIYLDEWVLLQVGNNWRVRAACPWWASPPPRPPRQASRRSPSQLATSAGFSRSMSTKQSQHVTITRFIIVLALKQVTAGAGSHDEWHANSHFGRAVVRLWQSLWIHSCLSSGLHREGFPVQLDLTLQEGVRFWIFWTSRDVCLRTDPV